MKRAYRAALLGGLLLPVALAFAPVSATAAANPQVEAELSRLITAYAATGQEGLDKLSEPQQKQLAACAADLLGALPAEDMTALTTGQDLEQVMDVLRESLENRAGAAAAEQLMGCFDTAMQQVEAAGQASGPVQTPVTPPAGDIHAQYLAMFESLLQQSNPPAPEAVTEMLACMSGTLAPVMTEDEKRQAVDQAFGEEIGNQLTAAHPAEFEQFMTCAEAVDAKYQ